MLSPDFIMGGQFPLTRCFGCYGRYNDRGAMFFADVVLYDNNRAAPLLFGANATTKIGVIHLAALICSFHLFVTSLNDSGDMYRLCREIPFVPDTPNLCGHSSNG